MSSNQDTGKNGELAAADFLKKAGYEILDTNWRAGSLEIDIVALKNEVVAFVEVKTRSGIPLMDAAKAVSRQKQKDLIRAANLYIQKKGLDKEVRFDIITVQKEAGKITEHIESAYRAYI